MELDHTMTRSNFILGAIALLVARKPPPKRRTYGQDVYGFGSYGGR